MIKLNLVVLRTQNLLEMVGWYSKTFYLKFVTEKHADEILHYSAPLSGGLLEIYPTEKNSSNLTFGIAVDKILFENIFSNIKHKNLGENLILIKDSDKNSIIISLSE